jgi:sugar phosphate isomerase/epimerase
MTVELALTPDGRWDFPVSDLASAASAAGFGALGINADKVDAAAVDAYNVAGLRCHEVMALVVTDDDKATTTAAEHLARLAQTIGAEWVLTVFTTPPSTELVQMCANVIGEGGAGMAVEFSPLGPVATIHDGMRVVRSAQANARAGLLIDSWHFCFGGSTWDDLATVALDDIAYVQFTDALEPLSPDRLVRETLHRRALPGDGILELDRFAATLLDRGWDGLVSVEVLNAELRELPVDIVVRRLHDATARYWR